MQLNAFQALFAIFVGVWLCALAVTGCTQIYQYGQGDSLTFMQMGMGTVPVQVGPGTLP